jgi:hypothetical protein
MLLLLFGCIAQAPEAKGPEPQNVTPPSAEQLPNEDLSPAPKNEPDEVLAEENITEPVDTMPKTLKDAFEYGKPLNCTVSENGEFVVVLNEEERMRADFLQTEKLRGINGIIYDGSICYVWGAKGAISYRTEDVTKAVAELGMSAEDLGFFDQARLQRTYQDADVNCTEWATDENSFNPPELQFADFREMFPYYWE